AALAEVPHVRLAELDDGRLARLAFRPADLQRDRGSDVRAPRARQRHRAELHFQERTLVVLLDALRSQVNEGLQEARLSRHAQAQPALGDARHEELQLTGPVDPDAEPRLELVTAGALHAK